MEWVHHKSHFPIILAVGEFIVGSLGGGNSGNLIKEQCDSICTPRPKKGKDGEICAHIINLSGDVSNSNREGYER